MLTDVLSGVKPWTIIHGDNRGLMRDFPPKIFHAAITSPPYFNARDYGLPPTVWGGRPDCDHDWEWYTRKAVDGTVSYSKDRTQFGRSIGSFQVIQHYCATMATDVEGIRLATCQAAWRIDHAYPATMEVAIAKAWVSSAYRRVTALGHQIHGGIGFCWEHDLQFYFRRAKTAAMMFGDATHHIEVVAQQLGL